MSFHLKTTKAVVIRKIMVGVVFFLLSILTLHTFADLKWFVFPAEVRFSLYAIAAFFSVAAAILLGSADRAAKRVLQDYVLRRECYAHMTLSALTEELQSILNLRELSNLVVNSFAEALHLKTTALFVLRPEQDSFEAISAYGWPASELRRTRLPGQGLFAEIIRKSGEHTLTRNVLIKSVGWEDANYLEHDFNSIRAGWVLPLFFKTELVGFLAFGSESPDRVFEKADFEFFLRFARKVAVCVKNAIEVETLTKRNDELQGEQSQRFQMSKIRAISQLAEGLGHEIHNPLAIISGKAQVLLFKKGELDWDKRVEEALTVMIQQSKRAADIIRKVLTSVRESQAPPREIDLKKMAFETAELLRYQASLKQIEIKIDAEENLMFFANPGDIHEIFSGFILNGMEMLGSHGWIRMDLHRMRNEDAIEMLVTDSGRGLHPEMLDQVFDPFFKIRHEALGLGLFATKQIVHRYGGSIRAESREGEGVVFQIQLPLYRAVERVATFDQDRMTSVEMAPERK